MRLMLHSCCCAGEGLQTAAVNQGAANSALHDTTPLHDTTQTVLYMTAIIENL